MSDSGFAPGGALGALSFYAVNFWPFTLAVLVAVGVLGLKLSHRSIGALCMGLAVTGIFALASGLFACLR